MSSVRKLLNNLPTSLEYIDLGDGEFLSLDEEIGKFRNLKVLKLDRMNVEQGRKIHMLPESIGNLII